MDANFHLGKSFRRKLGGGGGGGGGEIHQCTICCSSFTLILLENIIY